MTKLIFEVGKQEHAIIKLIAELSDKSMKDFTLEALEEKIARETEIIINFRDKKPSNDKELTKISRLFVKKYSAKS